MDKYSDLINMETVVDTIRLVEDKLRTRCVENLESKIRQGVSVGKYTIVSTDIGYDVMVDGRMLHEGIDSLDVAFSIVQLKIKKPAMNVIEYICADKEYAKIKNNVAVYSHTIESSDNSSAVMVAEDRLNVAVLRMDEYKHVLSRLKLEANVALFDK